MSNKSSQIAAAGSSLKCLSTGELAELAQTTRGTLRLYERYGLIEPVQRSASGYRAFAPDAVVTLKAIRVAQQAGFTLAEIAGLMQLIDEEPFDAEKIKAKLQGKAREIRVKIRHLQNFNRFLDSIAAAPETLLDPACDVMLEIALTASSKPLRPARINRPRNAVSQ